MILAEKEISFKTLEQKIYEEMCMIGRKILAEILKKIDGRLMAERDRSIYRHKGFQKTALKTIMGEVEIERVKYIYKEESGEESCRYLLDEMIGLNGGVGNISENLVMKIASSCCEMPYRKAAEMISEITGQTISHMGVWQVVQTLGDAVTQKEDEASKLVKKHESVGQVEKKLLFEEQDGVWLSIQGKDRKKHANLQATDIYSTNEANVAGADLPTPSIETSPSDSPDKTQTPLNKTDKPVKKVYAEMKVAIAYSGAKKTGKNRYNLVDKVATAGFEGVDKFYERKEGVIGEYFSIDEIEQRILNADGASWAKRSITDEDVHYQLDTRHRNEAIRRNVKDPDKRKKLRELLYEKKIDELFSTIKGYINESANNEELKTEHENYKKLLNYYISNKDGLIPYKQRGLILPPPSGKSTGVTPSEDDIVYRNCGAMESNIFSLIGFRMKGRRMSWSIDGGNHLAKLLTRKVTGKLGEVLEDIAVSNKIPKKYVEETLDLPVDNPPISSAKMPERVGKGWNGFVKGTISSAMKWAKDLFKIKLFD